MKKKRKHYLLLPIFFMFALLFSAIGFNVYADSKEANVDNYYGDGVNLPDASLYDVPWDKDAYGVAWSKANVNYYLIGHEDHDTTSFLGFKDGRCTGNVSLAFTTITDADGNPIDSVTAIEYVYKKNGCSIGNTDSHVCSEQSHHVKKDVNQLQEQTAYDEDGTFIKLDYVVGWNHQKEGISVPLISNTDYASDCGFGIRTIDDLAEMVKFLEALRHSKLGGTHCSTNKTDNKNEFCDPLYAAEDAAKSNYLLFFDCLIEDLLYLNVWYLTPILDTNGDVVLNEDGSVQMEEVGATFNDTGAHPIFDKDGKCMGIYDANGNLLDGYKITTNGNPYYQNSNGEIVYTIDRATQQIISVTLSAPDAPNPWGIFSVLGNFGSVIGNGFRHIGNFVSDTVDNIGNVFEWTGNAVGNMFDLFGSLPNAIKIIFYVIIVIVIIWVVKKIYNIIKR